MNQEVDNTISDSHSAYQRGVEELSRDLCNRLSLDQLVLMRLYGRSLSGELSQPEFVALLENYALELPGRKRRAVQKIARDVAKGVGFVEALNRGRKTPFGLMQQALRTAQQEDSLPEFMRAIALVHPSRRPLALLYEDTLKKQLKRLSVKTFVIFWFTGFILFFIVPEFQKMYQEFGIELPTSMSSFMRLCDWFANTFWDYVMFPVCLLIDGLYKLWPFGWVVGSILGAILVCVVLPGCLLIFGLDRLSPLLGRVFRRLSPWNWLQQPLSKQQQRKLLFAWSGGNSLGSSASKKSGFTKKEAAALKTASSPETRSWLIGRSFKENDRKRARWRSHLGDAFVLIWNLLLACLVGWVAVSILSSLITIVEGLG